MTREAIFETMTEIFRNIFDDDNFVIDDSTCASDIEDWDSFEQVSIMMAMKHSFGVEFDFKEVATLQSVGEMVDLIRAKL